MVQTVKNLLAMWEIVGLIPGSRKSTGEGNGNPLLVFLPGEFHAQGASVGYSSWSHRAGHN